MFSSQKRKNNCYSEKERLPEILGHAIAIHKAQSSTLDYMKSDLDSSTQAKSSDGTAQCYTCNLLKCAKSRDKVKLFNFKPSYYEALNEINWMRAKTMFSCHQAWLERLLLT